MKYEVLNHASIRIEGSKIIYVDPYQLNHASHDADFVFITHSHYDHFSTDDILKVSKPVKLTPDDGFDQDNTIVVTPESVVLLNALQNIVLNPGATVFAFGIQIETVPAYNINKPYHSKENGWLGYLITLDGVRYYIAGDTDDTPEARAVKCDVAFIPVGGTYTCNVEEAVELAKAIAPSIEAVPTHYGSEVGTIEMGDAFRALLKDSKHRENNETAASPVPPVENSFNPKF